MEFPKPMGHEFCGEVVEVGEGVERFAVGDRVVSGINMIPCGICRNCTAGRYNVCLAPPRRQWTGAFAEYISVPHQGTFRLPDNISFEVAPVIEPACVAYSAVKKAGVQLVEKVAILGMGAIGLVATQCVRLYEPAQLIVTDMMEFRLELAKEFGADVAIDAGTKGYAEEIRDLAGGLGVDRVIITAGKAGLLDDAIQMVRPGGVIVVSGLTTESETFVMSRFLVKDLELRACHKSPGVWEDVIALVASCRIDLDPLATHFFPLRDIDKAFDAFANAEREKAVRVVVRCGSQAEGR